MLKKAAASAVEATTAAATAALATTMQKISKEQREEQREVSNRTSRELNALLRHFDQLPEETADSLATELEDKLLHTMGLQGVVKLRGRRLPHSRDKAHPPPVILSFSSMADKALFLSRRKKLQSLPWSLDDDLTPAQQQQRRDQWPEYLRHKQAPEKPKVFWRGADLMVNNKLWKPLGASPG